MPNTYDMALDLHEEGLDLETVSINTLEYLARVNTI